MELAFRKGSDAFVPAGGYRALESRLFDRKAVVADISAVVVSCFDVRTRLMPFILYDKFIFPAGARMVAAALKQAGFDKTRAVFELWNPKFRASKARIDGKPPQILLLSTMQLHADKAMQAIQDAWSLGEERPLIIVGGPKCFHEPYHFWPVPTSTGIGGADVAVTGEVYILLDLLEKILDYHRPGEHIRKSFERARQARALDEVPGIVYLDPDAEWREPKLVDTGLQRLVQHLDELPHEATGLSLLEPPSKSAGLADKPLSDKAVKHHARVVSMVMTQGCKFSCSYCPIPSLNQKTWRYRSPEGMASEFKAVRDRYGIRFFFGADDNFFNRRETASDFFDALSRTKLANGKRLGRHIQWGTEATQFDTHRNIDLLPIARESGMSAIWFGIEDLTAELINKGQKPEKTIEVFQAMHRNKISPMAMMMFHDAQPFDTPGELYGLANQMDFLRKAGAVSVQVTIHVPAIGTKEWERTFETGGVIKTFDGVPIRNRYFDGNHAVVKGRVPMWQKQAEQLAGYFRFYNPMNLFRSLRDDKSPLRWYRVGYQLGGMYGTTVSAIKLLPHLVRLWRGKLTFCDEAPPLSEVPIRYVDGSFLRFPESHAMHQHGNDECDSVAA
jgi:radical SAM superfamily enzyme YgiQ (UPF0313 family)